MKQKIFFFIFLLFAIYYISFENTYAFYGSFSDCYYGTSCATQGYSTPPEGYCPAFYATYAKGYPTCTYGPLCCGSDAYCTAIFAGSSYPVPDSCTKETCKYKNQQDCTGGRVCDASGCVCPSNKPKWDTTSSSCVECLSNPDCTDPAKPKCDPTYHTCVANPVCTLCSDGTAVNACNAAGQRCLDMGTCQLTADPNCAKCAATFSITSGTGDPCKITPSVSGGCLSKAFEIKKGSNTLCTGNTDSTGAGSCFFWQLGTAVDSFDLYIDAIKKDTKSGSCGGSDGGDGGGGGGGNPSSGGCSYLYVGALSPTPICSSGCPASYPNQQQVCCDTNEDKGCNGGPACASYNPTVGETPCCYATGYKTCSKQEACTSTGCENVCTTADKTSDLYCSKCNSCQDGIQNCGEPSVDKCGEPCTVSQTTEYVKWSPYYCWQVCANDGATCVAVMGSSGQYYPQGCSEGWTGNCKCSKTEDVFNPPSCSDGVQNCAETCLDGSAQCNAGTKETDNTYLVSFEFSQPAELSGTSLYSDANSWNCADGIDNDHDCLVDCADPDSSL